MTLANLNITWFNTNASNDKTLKQVSENIFKNAKKYNFSRNDQYFEEINPSQNNKFIIQNKNSFLNLNINME